MLLVHGCGMICNCTCDRTAAMNNFSGYLKLFYLTTAHYDCLLTFSVETFLFSTYFTNWYMRWRASIKEATTHTSRVRWQMNKRRGQATGWVQHFVFPSVLWVTGRTCSPQNKLEPFTPKRSVPNCVQETEGEPDNKFHLGCLFTVYFFNGLKNCANAAFGWVSQSPLQ